MVKSYPKKGLGPQIAPKGKNHDDKGPLFNDVATTRFWLENVRGENGQIQSQKGLGPQIAPKGKFHDDKGSLFNDVAMTRFW